MRKKLASATVILSCLPALAGAFEAVDLLDYSGEELFQRFCASCHGETARGDGPVAPSLAAAVPDLTRISERYGSRFPALWIAETIDGRAVVRAHGPRYMPIWGYEFWIEEGGDVGAQAATRQIVERIVEYLREIQVQRDGWGPVEERAR